MARRRSSTASLRATESNKLFDDPEGDDSLDIASDGDGRRGDPLKSCPTQLGIDEVATFQTRNS
jgi:hypothetical protein